MMKILDNYHNLWDLLKLLKINLTRHVNISLSIFIQEKKYSLFSWLIFVLYQQNSSFFRNAISEQNCQTYFPAKMPTAHLLYSSKCWRHVATWTAELSNSRRTTSFELSIRIKIFDILPKIQNTWRIPKETKSDLQHGEHEWKTLSIHKELPLNVIVFVHIRSWLKICMYFVATIPLKGRL